MRLLKGSEGDAARRYIGLAGKAALESLCDRARCGTVIVSDGKVIGRGFNQPPGGIESQRRCSLPKDSYHPKVTDKTCCVHAEEDAVIDALKNYPDRLAGSALYFSRIDKSGAEAAPEEPYCTICSKLALHVGIKEFVLLQDQGIISYPTEEYNSLSYSFKKTRS